MSHWVRKTPKVAPVLDNWSKNKRPGTNSFRPLVYVTLCRVLAPQEVVYNGIEQKCQVGRICQ